MKQLPIRQGDVVLIHLEQAPAAAKRAVDAEGRPLAGLRVEGERTGHAHVLPARVYDAPTGRFLFLERPMPLTHQEHGVTEVPAGWWEVRLQREHVPQQAATRRFD